MTVTAEIDKFIEAWIKTMQVSAKAMETKDVSPLYDTVGLKGSHTGNYVSQDGFRHLRTAAKTLLAQERLQQRISKRTAIDALTESFFEKIDKVSAGTGKLTAQGVVESAKAKLLAANVATGKYVYPLVFAPRAKTQEWVMGPVRIVPKDKFLTKYAEALNREIEVKDDWRKRLHEDWHSHIASYDHFAIVEVVGHERELAEKVGREAAEFCLNLIRMRFGYSHTDDIRIGGGFIFETKQSRLYFDDKGEAIFGSTSGPWGTHLDEDWPVQMNSSLGYVVPLFGSFLRWFLAGEEPDNPIIERLRYAGALISEAYCEPHDHIRLVRLISALESLALLDRKDKAHFLGVNCGLVGGEGDMDDFHAIFEAVRVAYTVRSAIVHGDRLNGDEIMRAFLGLERYILKIFVGFVHLYREISVDGKPQSIGALKRAFKSRATMFFWAPEYVSSLSLMIV